MLDKSEQRLVDDIVKHGWHLIGVLASKEAPPFTYSIGMMVTLDHPEVIIVGLEHQTSARMINTIGAEIRDGRRFTEPVLYEGIVVNFACKIRPVSAAAHNPYFGFAQWHRRHIGKPGTLQAVQCLWPDKAGLFPDEEGCHPAIVGLQPLL